MNYKRLIIICIGVVILLTISHYKDIDLALDYIIDGAVSEERLLQRKAREENICIVSEQQGVRKFYYTHYSIGNEYVVFSYMNGSVVDAYNHNGIYQFTIIVPDSQNGVPFVRCVDDLILISSKDHITYIFQGNELIDYLTKEEATLAGYSYEWYKNQPGLEKDKDYIYLKDENGNILLQATIPNTVKYA